MAYLIYKVEDSEETRIEIKNDISVVGRHSECDITIPDDMISRRHIEIIHKEDRFFVVDLGSRNGCFHNSKRITAMRELHDGDLLEMGKTVINFFNPAEPKETLKGYQLNNRISKGGMGTVYKGRQLSLDRIVAIKILHEKLSSRPKFVEQFQAEARAAGILNHPNIIQVYDCGEEGGRQFFAMEYVDGLTLRQLLNKNGPVDLKEALRIGADICKGIGFAHEKDIIHKDIKPENIMLTRDNKVKIADLGLAESIAVAESDLEERPIVGTPQYMPPEQANGDILDERTDIYAIGGTLYHLISGHSVFPGKKSQTTLIEMQRSTPAPDLYTEMDEKIPKRISRMIMRCLEKKPKNRWRNCDQLLNEIELCIEELENPNQEKPKITSTRRKSSINKNRNSFSTSNYKPKRDFTPIFIGIAVVIIGLIFGIGYINDKNSKIATYNDMLNQEKALIMEGKPIAALSLHYNFLNKTKSHPRFQQAKTDKQKLLESSINEINNKIETATNMIVNNNVGEAKRFMQDIPNLPDKEIPEQLRSEIQDTGLFDLFLELNAVKKASEKIEIINKMIIKKQYQPALLKIDEFINQFPHTKIANYFEDQHSKITKLIQRDIDDLIENTNAESNPAKAIKMLQTFIDKHNPPAFAKQQIKKEIHKLRQANSFFKLYHNHTVFLKQNDYVNAINSLEQCAKIKHPSAKRIPAEIRNIKNRILQTTQHKLSMVNSEIKHNNFKNARKIITDFTTKYKLPKNCLKMLQKPKQQITQMIKNDFVKSIAKINQLTKDKMYNQALKIIQEKEKNAQKWGVKFKGLKNKDEILNLAKQHNKLIHNMQTYLPINPSFNLTGLQSSVPLKGMPITNVDDIGIKFKKVITVTIPWKDVPKPFYTFLILKYKNPRK